MKIFFFIICLLFSSVVLAKEDKEVIVNFKTKIYHSLDCHLAHKCVKRCGKTTRKKAISQGARACGICKG